MKRSHISACLLVALVSFPAGAAPKAPAVKAEKEDKDKKELPKGAPSKAVTDAIIDAIGDEMQRGMQLSIEGAPRPAAISYKVTEVEVNDVTASLGQISNRRERHFVNIEARVRVQVNNIDNGNFSVPNGEEIDGVVSLPLPLEATPRIVRRVTWLVTDAAYKEALMQLRAKLEARRAGGARPAEAPGWTTEKPVTDKTQVLVPELEPITELEARARTISAGFRDQPHVRDARIALTSYLERRWYISTEGTSATDTRRASGALIVASGQADDGQPLSQYFLRYGHTAHDLPSDKELGEQVKTLSDNLKALASAPVMERYRGPVLFEGEAAVGLLRASLAPNLGGTPTPEGLSPQEARLFGGGLTDQVGVRVVSPLLSVVDDPTAREGGGKALIGGYKIDDEGVAAQRVQVIKDGNLKSLLTSRTPSQKGQQSNGHARRTAQGGAFHGSATNLFVTGKGGIPRKALEQRLVAEARKVGLKYGLAITQLDDAAITSAPEWSRREIVQFIKTGNIELPPPSSLAYRIYPNGKRELVRGAQIDPVPITAWEDVLGVSKEVTVYNFLATDQSQLQLRLTTSGDEGFVPSAGIESGIITPDLMLKRLDVRGVSENLAKPLLAKPSK